MHKRFLNLTFFKSILAIFLVISFFSCKSTDKRLTPQELLRNSEFEEARGRFVSPDDINATDEEGNTVLHIAAEINDCELISYFLFKGADTEIKNKAGKTPLHVAIENDSYEAARDLATAGANIFSVNSDGITALDFGISKSNTYYDIFVTSKTGEIRELDGRTIVHYFVQKKNLTGVQHCIKKQIPISVKDNSGKTPLDLAFEDGNDIKSVNIAAALIESGADKVESEFSYFQDIVSERNLDMRFDDGQTALHLSTILGHNAISEYLLENGAQTTPQNSTGSTPLHEAVRYGRTEIAKMLLNSGAKIDAKDNLGKTPIMVIPPKDKLIEMYDILVSYKANLTEKDMYGDSILHTTALMECESEIFERLIQGGADINSKNKDGVTPLMIAVQKDNVSLVKYLASKGADIHTQDNNKNSPISLALVSSRQMLEALVNKSNVMTQDSEGNTPLHKAIENDIALDKIQYIVSLMDDVNSRNRDGNSALYLAVLKNREKVGEILLAKDADIFSTNTKNSSPLKLALKHSGSVQDWLITSKTIKSTDGSGNTVLHYAAEWQFSDAITSLLVKGADINAKNANGETPLFSATKTDNPEIIRMIVDGGALINTRDNLGSTPIHAAVRLDALNSIAELIKLGIDVNSANTAGKTPLAEAAITGKYETTKFLLENKANPNATDANGITVLMDAITCQNPEIVKLLIDYDANPNIQDINGRNSYHEAVITLNKEIIQTIRNAGGNPLARDKKGVTPFSLVLNADFDIIQEVLGESTTITDSDGNTPVHIVVKNNGSDSLLKTLIEKGYFFDTRNADGYTPLSYAIEENNCTKALLLLEKGANPFQPIDKNGTNGITIALEKNDSQMLGNITKYAGNMTDIKGNTILHYAVKSSSLETVQGLLSYGIEKNVKNVSGDTPYTIALRWRRTDIADLLKADYDAQ